MFASKRSALVTQFHIITELAVVALAVLR